MKQSSLPALLDVMDHLLAPDGCPWDREQTHQSLMRYLVEETYEVLEAIEEADMNKLREELGDLLLQVVFHAALAKNAGEFDFYDVAETVRQKMIRRHPHVFGDVDIQTSDGVMEIWEGLKKKEGKKTVLEGIPRSLPALQRAFKMQEKARRVGFDWPDVSGAIEKLEEEMDEFHGACASGSREEMIDEMGDILFAAANIARMSGIEPEEALQRSNNKFARRFQYIEQRVKDAGKVLEEQGLEALDALWDEAKRAGL
ncbi:MAG: nucleoside triphosphate pyrophosphohydrolase [Solirubrobacterales bacterium]